MKIDYNEISKEYDDVRTADIEMLKLMIEGIHDNNNTCNVLDFGCGTGNYMDLMSRVTGYKIYGVEPSKGMREKAVNKNLDIRTGNHEHIPFQKDFFDFIYMVDVIHHITDLGLLFHELCRVLKPGGQLCISTESHEQISRRFYVKFFPTTAEVDQGRYPDIQDIVDKALLEGFKYTSKIAFADDRVTVVDDSFIRLVEKKGYSMFHLIDDKEYKKGLEDLKNSIIDESGLKLQTSGGTLIWLESTVGDCM